MLPSSVPWIRRPGAGVSALLRHSHGPILIGGSHSLVTPNHLSVVWARMFSPKLLGSVSSLVAQNQGVHARVSEGAGAWAQLAGTYAWHTNIGFNASALDSAQDFARRALALDPNDANAQSVLGNAYVNMGRLRCAETAARRSLELHPNQSRAVRALAELHRDGGDFAEAMKYHPRTENDSLTCTPTNLAEWLPLSDRALHRRFERVRRHAERAIAIADPGAPCAITQLESAYDRGFCWAWMLQLEPMSDPLPRRSAFPPNYRSRPRRCRGDAENVRDE
jgi:Tfp pilus assembly protein PilF